MQKAWSTLEIKSIDAEQRVITGIASTPAPDRDGDVMVPSGAEFSLPLPFLWQHREPIGEVFEAKVLADGIHIKARLPKIVTPGNVKSRVDDAWTSISSQPPLVRGLSIGWGPIGKGEKIAGGFTRWAKWMLGEVSAVVVPANTQASILSVKSADMAASGPHTPGDTGKSTVVRVQKDARTMTTQEQISGLENKRAASTAAINAIQTKVTDEGRTKDDAEREEFNDLKMELKSIDLELEDLRDLEKLNIKAATAITATKSTVEASALRGGQSTTASRVTITPLLPKGAVFTRHVMAIAAGLGDSMRALEYAKQWKDTPEVELMVKAAVAAGTTTTAGFMAELAVQQPQNDFLDLLRPKTILGRIPNLRRVPFNVSVGAQTAGGTYAWVGQGKVKPLTSTTTATVTLGINKIAGIIVLTQELVKISSPSAQELVQNEMIAGITKFMDEQLIDPAVAASGTVTPASITNGTSAITSAGTSADNALTDVKAVMATFLAANLSTDNAVWIMSEANAFALMTAVNALGAPLFPGMANGGMMLLGRPVIASQSAGTTVALVDAQGILVADDGGVSIDVSKEASLQMDSAPDDPATASTVMVSLFQLNLVGIRAERFVTWKRARTASVKYVAASWV